MFTSTFRALVRETNTVTKFLNLCSQTLKSVKHDDAYDY